jgi:hypothetical protein
MKRILTSTAFILAAILSQKAYSNQSSCLDKKFDDAVAEKMACTNLCQKKFQENYKALARDAKCLPFLNCLCKKN